MNETIRTLRERRSVRSFLPDPIPENILDAILEAGTWAATGRNGQSPVMVVVRDRETIDYMERLNAAVMGQPEGHPFYGAPMVVVVLADGDNYNWLRDGSLVMGNLMNAAHSLGIGSCWINRAQEVFDTPEGKALLRAWGLSENYRGVANCILGWPNGPLPAPKPRKADYIRKV
jgi:nitroreductase